MGLCTSHDCFSGGYGQFHYFRRCVAEVVGIPLDVMEGFYIAEEWLIWAGDSELHKEMLSKRLEALPVSWKAFEHDPICILLRHSDCEGEIAWEDAIPIAERLEAIAPHIEWSGRSDWDFKARCLQFAEGLRLAAERQENVEFH